MATSRQHSPQESPQKKPEFTGPGTSDILARLSPRATLGGMQNNLVDLAAQYHKALPGRIHRYLNDRGIPDLVIDFHLLGWHENLITLPIFNRMGELAFFKLARDPEAPTLAPKMLASPGAYAELYGWDQVIRKPNQIIICEGEFDRLVLEGKGFIAVTSTGGAGTGPSAIGPVARVT